MNILVDPASGNMTGVVDWARVSFLPFGFSLYVLEHALGGMSAKQSAEPSKFATLPAELIPAF